MIIINNTHEKQFFGIVSPKMKFERRMYRQPFEQLMNLRRDRDSFIVSQSPLIDIAGYTQWSDFSILDKKKDTDLRVEISSLEPNSDLGFRMYKNLEVSKLIPEKLLMLILIGNGYDDIIKYYLRPAIEKDKLPVTIVRTMNDFKYWFNSMYRK